MLVEEGYPTNLNESAWERIQELQLVSIDGDQSRGHGECSRIDRTEPMAWPTPPYVSSQTRLTNGGRIHPETLVEDGLL